jgi:hypothetical protein
LFVNVFFQKAMLSEEYVLAGFKRNCHNLITCRVLVSFLKFEG